MSDLQPIQMTDRERAYWLAGKVPNINDYTSEAMAMLLRLADEVEILRRRPDPERLAKICDMIANQSARKGIPMREFGARLCATNIRHAIRDSQP